MNQKEPLISVILPVCNSAKFLKEALMSLSKQSYKLFEIIAIDDNSKDESYGILLNWKKQESRLKVFRNIKRYGFSVSLNRGVKRAKGHFIAFMSPHDFSTPSRFKKQLSFLLKHPKFVAVGSQSIFTDENNKRIGKSSFPLHNELIYESFLKKNTIQCETIMINRLLIPKDILYFTHHVYPFIYTNVLIKLLSYGKFANLGEFLHIHREYLTGSFEKTNRVQNLIAWTQLWLKSLTLYEYRPSLRSLFGAPQTSTT